MKSVHTGAIGLLLLLALLFTAGVSAGDSGSRVYIKEVGVLLILPKDYSLRRSDEPNRRGSFACYRFRAREHPNFPSLQEIQFFSKKSIRRFENYWALRVSAYLTFLEFIRPVRIWSCEGHIFGG